MRKSLKKNLMLVSLLAFSSGGMISANADVFTQKAQITLMRSVQLPKVIEPGLDIVGTLINEVISTATKAVKTNVTTPGLDGRIAVNGYHSEQVDLRETFISGGNTMNIAVSDERNEFGVSFANLKGGVPNEKEASKSNDIILSAALRVGDEVRYGKYYPRIRVEIISE